jgi:hypothetical protein
MNEDFIPFELADKLKEKGFRKPCVATYDKDGILGYNYYQPKNIKAVSFDDCLCISDDLVLAPTISQVLKWLRKEKKIHIEIFLYNGKYGYLVNSITQICEDDLFHECLNEDTVNEEYTTYEQAAIAGISYVLDNLI